MTFKVISIHMYTCIINYKTIVSYLNNTKFQLFFRKEFILETLLILLQCRNDKIEKGSNPSIDSRKSRFSTFITIGYNPYLIIKPMLW